MCRLILTAGVCLIIANLASSASLTNTARTNQTESDKTTQGSAPSATTESDGSTDNFCEGKADGDYVNPINPNTYYTCSNGLTYTMTCPENLIFKQSCNCCEWPTTISDGLTVDFCKGKKNGNYFNPSNIHSFYSCSNGLTYIMNCPENLIFKQSCNCCEWPTTISDGLTVDFCKGKKNGNYFNPSNIHSFYSCSNGLTYIMNCPENLIFRESLNACVWP